MVSLLSFNDFLKHAKKKLSIKALLILSAIFCTGTFNHVSVQAASISPSPIDNCTKLQNIGVNVASLQGSYVLTQNIDCSMTNSWNSGAGFLPIAGAASSPGFSGALDGQGYAIKGLYEAATIASSKTIPYGLFGKINKATISNVRLENIQIQGGNAEVGALAGLVQDSTISNVVVTNARSALRSMAIEANQIQWEIQNITNPTPLDSNVGGLIGKSINTKISQSSSDAWIKSQVPLVV